jgi:hypothetical protein
MMTRRARGGTRARNAANHALSRMKIAARALTALWLAVTAAAACEVRYRADSSNASGLDSSLVQPLPAQRDQAAYTGSVAAISRRQGVDDSIAVPGARSILLADGAPTARAIVLLHGLTDSPRQFERFAYLLHADGNNVYVPRLPQHGLRGSNVGALSALTAAQLRGVADSVVNEARGLGDSVVVAETLELGSSILGQAAREASRTRDIVVLVNASDRTIQESAAEALARNWLQHGATVLVFELPDSLRLPHNIIDPIGVRVAGNAVLNLLRELAYGIRPSALVRPVILR